MTARTRQRTEGEDNSLASAVLARHRRRTRGADPTGPAGDDPAPVPERLLVPTGSTLLNLALSGSPWGALPPGSMVSMPGESNSGKTMLARSMFAEMCADPRFADWDLVHDNAEAKSGDVMPAVFGTLAAARVRTLIPLTDPPCSNTVESFLLGLVRMARAGRPFLYVLDSLDALVATEEQERLEAKLGGAKAKGTMGMERAKQMSELLRLSGREVARSGGVLVLISQTRDDNASPFPGAKTTAGGRALLFWAVAQLWLKVLGRIKTPDKRHTLGVTCAWRVRKNHITGREGEGEFPIYYALGIDDVGNCVDWLVAEGVWPQRKLTVEAPQMRLAATRDKLLRTIEQRGWERNLRELVGREWARTEERAAMRDRKRRYE